MKTNKILILQTAFLGDVILTLPLLNVLKKKFPGSEIDFICIPETSEILINNSYISEIIPYDKKKSGLYGLIELILKLRKKKYDLIISPHRSYRSSLISYMSSPLRSIAFKNSSLSFLYSETVEYLNDKHEIIRNLNLLKPLGIIENDIIRPELFISENEKRKIDCLFYEHKVRPDEKFIVIAPGSVWFTKRFPEEKFRNLCDMFSNSGIRIFLAGGKSDKKVSDFILNNSKNRNIVNVTGQLSVPESAELISRASVLVTNDSSPLHMGNAVGTDVIALFGATVPAFGFYPYGINDVIIETKNLKCRPCAIHGGKKCPIGTFDCMLRINEKDIYDSVVKLSG